MELEDSNSFLDGLISPDTRRRTREQTQPLVDVLCSPICIRSAVLTIGSALLLLTTLLIAVSLSRTSSYDNTQISYVPIDILDYITDGLLRSNIEYLASDLLEGRGTGTRGENLTAHYIASHFIAAGLAPGVNGSYYQQVPLASINPIAVSDLTLDPTLILNYPTQFTASSDYVLHSLSLKNHPMVFVGYGIDAPGFDWNDYKDVNVSNKIVVCLVNEPSSSTDKDFFAGDTLTYYGRWTYKIEQARAKGALGILLIHTTATAGYGWQVVENSFAGEQVVLTEPPIVNPLHFRGWINEDAAKQLAVIHNSTLDEWLASASSRNFVPFSLTTRLSIQANYSIRHFSGTNVVARLGPEVDETSETVVMMAHHDHLGIRPAVGTSSDQIYNGAVDNASGVAALIASAYSLGSLYHSQIVTAPTLSPKLPHRSIIFVSVTGEESNLLGSSFFTLHPPCKASHSSPDPLPVCGATSMLNFDIMNVWGPTSDVVAIGYGMSSYMDELAQISAREEGLTLTPDPTPHLGHLFRSDQLPFALAHIPSLTLSQGVEYWGQPSNYYEQVMQDYVDNHYHQPSDEYDPAWSMMGVIQQTRMMVRIAYRLATSDTTPSLENNDILPAV